MRRLVPVLLVTALALAGCQAADRGPTAATPDAATGLSGELTVYAAASLGAAFDELAGRFERQHPSLDVLPIVYDGSSTLATQLVEGAPADVFASADEKNMARVIDAGLATESAVFATNTLVIAVPAGNPGRVTGLESLGDPDLTVLLCAPEVPCGAAAATLLDIAGVRVEPASIEQNVTAVLTKVAADEADAGLVYVTDVRQAEGVEAIQAEGAADVVNRYPVTMLTDAGNPAAAAAFLDFVLSDEGRAVLADFGFGAP
ncbi:molybdate ABC transporter substrate-binding protein [Planococcus sp. APC 4015]|nr:molybdate ABC transporter substrate-binding protein [Planococcus sp. APC 4015]